MAYVTIGPITIDAVLDESLALDSEVTTLPRETKIAMTDNIRPLPKTLALECVVSDAPIGADLIAIRERETAGVLAVSDFVFAQLEAMYEAREVVTVATSLRVYPNMAMTSCAPKRDKDTSRLLSFSCTFTQITIVTNQRTTVNALAKQGLKGSKVYKTQVIKLANGSTERRVIYDNGPKAKPQYTYGDGSAYYPKSGNAYEKPTSQEVKLDKQSAGRARKGEKRVPNTPVKPLWQPS